MSVQRIPSIILASQSPRRAALLADAGIAFTIVAPDPNAEGTRRPGELAASFVVRLAKAKADDVAAQLRRESAANIARNQSPAAQFIVAADTVAECDGITFGKPIDRDDARRMLRFLAGKRHRVWTGICIKHVRSNRERIEVDVTELQMSGLTDEELDGYLNSGKWEGKAGAFGYQDGNDWVEIVRGSASNVVGLPIELLQRMLAEFAVE